MCDMMPDDIRIGGGRAGSERQRTGQDTCEGDLAYLAHNTLTTDNAEELLPLERTNV
jgi:hypothetical protein